MAEGATTAGATNARAPPAAATGPTAPMWTNPARPPSRALAEAGDAMACRTCGEDSCGERREAGARGTDEKASMTVSVARHARWQSLRVDAAPEKTIIPSCATQSALRIQNDGGRSRQIAGGKTLRPPLRSCPAGVLRRCSLSPPRSAASRVRGTEWYLLPGLCGDFRTVGPRKGQASQRFTQRIP